MRIKIESAKCDGFGTCAAHAPEVFELDDWGFAIEKNDGVVPQGEEARTRRAIADCPVHAIVERR